ncbi:reverse transcriptase [Gossypium australe]|uniref:Reverse transcriptase n=1 Tax=Gossypium australe TaxID=47621 RepID=A0A5B6VZ45_9ROSI|nr:reverse transcriptase [Gossypium australe]
MDTREGAIVEGDEEIGMIACQYFSKLVSTRGRTNLDHILSNIHPIVTEGVNKEIVNALKDMSPTKTTGGDDILALFYQTYWHIDGSDVCLCLEFLNIARSLSALYHTNIFLISKRGSPSNMTHFRPIKLCNVLYKIISKAIMNRLQLIMTRFIGEKQSAFVSGRLITDNVIVALEMIHSFQQ